MGTGQIVLFFGQKRIASVSDVNTAAVEGAIKCMHFVVCKSNWLLGTHPKHTSGSTLADVALQHPLLVHVMQVLTRGSMHAHPVHKRFYKVVLLVSVL